MVKKAVKVFCQDDKTLTFLNYKWLDVGKHIGNDGLNLNDFGILQIVKFFMSFYIVFNNVKCLRCISISEQDSTAYYIQISRDINKNSNNKSTDWLISGQCSHFIPLQTPESLSAFFFFFFFFFVCFAGVIKWDRWPEMF